MDVSTMSDDVVEEEEIFSVILSNANPQNVTLMPNRATVAILDSTGKSMYDSIGWFYGNSVSLSSTSGNSFIHSTILHCIGE